ncbi:MAG TPA: hypothetical protein ENN88_02245, partial [Candidatus Coatesbacteria bacterium]|nr:hypothetical protein [Candidatus Coatesbacteria bacterium]
MNLIALLRWLLALYSAWPLAPVVGPAGTMLVQSPKGWEATYRGHSLIALRPDGRASFSLTILPKLEAPPTDGDLIKLGGLRSGELLGPLVCREIDSTYTRSAEYRRGNRFGLFAGIYAARRLWL